MVDSQTKKPRSNLFKLASVVLAPVICLLLIEGGLRVSAHSGNKRTLESAMLIAASPDPEGRTRFVDIIQPNDNDKIIYDLRPNLDTTFKGMALKTNSAGFRSPEVPLEAEPGQLTILGVGASIMFGHGLADGEEYIPQVQAALNEQYPERSWRFINTAVPSHNLVMKIETLMERGLAYKPDLVFVNIAGNNLDLPQYIRTRQDPLDMGRSYLWDFFRERKERKQISDKRTEEMAYVDKSKLTWRVDIPTHPDRIPEQFRDLVGWAPFRAAMDRLKELQAEHGFEVVIFACLEHDLVPAMLEEGSKRGFLVISLQGDLEAYLLKHTKQAFTIKKYARSNLIVSRNNQHPSVIQHKMAAERIMQDLKSLGIIERMLAR